MNPAPPVTTARTGLCYGARMFVSFEGLDGSGKTTQAELLREFLEEQGREVVATREPGGTELGERVRTLLLEGGSISPWAEAALFAAARAELADRVIRPALDRGADVVCDRYIDSSLAYQGLGRGLGLERILDLNRSVTGELFPDRTFVLLLDPEEAAARRDGTADDRIEREGTEFQQRVERAYREVAKRFPERVELLDGSLPPQELAAVIRERVRGDL
jgi:dTMP kinase